MTAILEFNSIYPEVRKMLCEKRKKDEEALKNINLDILGIMGGKKKKAPPKIKQQYSGEDDAEDLSDAENF